MSGLTFNFNPVQIPCLIKPGMVYTVCLTELEFSFLRKFEKASKTEILKERRATFETTNLTALVMKGLLTITEGVGLVHYELTYLGKKLVHAITTSNNASGPLTIV